MAFVSSNLFPDFEPHGFITTPFLEADYQSTRTFPPAVKTMALLENIFNKVLFKDRDDVTVNSFQFSSYNYDKDKCHFVIKYFDTMDDWSEILRRDKGREILCFTDKVRDIDEMSVLGDFEAHVMAYCRKYLYDAHGLPDFVYVCTAFGSRLRVWKQFRGDHEFGGLWGGYGPTVDRSSYLDVGNDDSSRQIKQALDRITAQSGESGNEDTASFYPGESAYTVSSSIQPHKFPSETSSRRVDAWKRKDESGKTVRSFFCQGKTIDTDCTDWMQVGNGILSKKRLTYQKDGHNVWSKD